MAHISAEPWTMKWDKCFFYVDGRGGKLANTKAVEHLQWNNVATVVEVEVTNVVEFFVSSMAAKQIWPQKRLYTPTMT